MSYKCIVILGSTATGKTKLALELAKLLPIEIINADSRAIYRELDIASAKPSAVEQSTVQHHLIDVVNLDEHFTVADYKAEAKRIEEDILSRGKIPVYVGGSGLYINSIIYDFQFRQKPEQATRSYYEELSIAELQAEIIAKNLPMPNNIMNKRHLQRVLESGSILSGDNILNKKYLLIGLKFPKDIHRQRIEQRLQSMLKSGLLNELKYLEQKYGTSNKNLISVYYYKNFKINIDELNTPISSENLTEGFNQSIVDDLRLAKKQYTWFKRNKAINWFDDHQVAQNFVVSKFQQQIQPIN